MNEKWFALTPAQLEQKLKTNAASGLSRKAARSRVSRESGSLFLLPRRSPWLMLADLFSDVALILLLLTAVLSLCFEEFRTGLPVLVMMGGYLLVVGYLSYRAQRMMESLSSFFTPTVRVIRGGRLFCVDFRSVVVGDVILVEAGDVLCCDARIVTSDSLRVRMRIDRERYASMDKASDGYVNPKENRAWEMVNMLHAGSVVETGSARAIVTAVGAYTYLGAMTGGIELPTSNEAPEFLRKFRKHCAKINMILLISVLPFSLISLLMSYMHGGNVLLSASFLTAIAIAVTTFSQLSCTVCKLFYTNRIRRMIHHTHPAAIRSVKVLDTLAHADYVFLQDGCALTDGILHCYAAATAEGEIRNFQAPSLTASKLFELVALYHAAATGTVTTGISGAGNYFTAISELMRQSNVDAGALKIRCSIQSYAPGNLVDSPERVCFTDLGQPCYLTVSCSPHLLAECGSVMIGGEIQPLAQEGRQKLEQMRQSYTVLHQNPVIFTLSVGAINAAPCFVGMVAIREGVDPRLEKNIAYLERSGCRVISFMPKDACAPHIPEQLLARGVVSKEDFLRRQLPLTYRFGHIRVYADFEREDVLTLLEYARAQGKRVVTVGFTEQTLLIAEKADAFVTCAPIHPRKSGLLDEELTTMERTGQQYSTSCTQTVKQSADLLIPRPKSGRGGIASLATAMLQIRSVYRNLSSLLCYMIWSQVVRLLVSAPPMLFGQPYLDGRHLLFCFCILDAFALLLLIREKEPRLNVPRIDYTKHMRVSDYFRCDQIMLIASLVSTVSIFVLPMILGWTDLFDQYLYKIEYTFTAVMLLHPVVLAVARYGTDWRELKKAFRNWIFLAELVVLAIFLALLALWEPFALLFEFERNPLPYFLLSFAPTLIFAATVILLNRRKSAKGSERPE